MNLLSSYSVVLLPENKLVQKAVNLSEALSSKHQTFFSLGKEVCVPHLSLYMLQLQENDIIAVKSLLESIAKHNQTIQLKSLRYRQSYGYIEVEYSNSPEIKALQAKVVNELNHYRQGILPTDELIFAASSGEKLLNFKSYGYAYVGSLLRPHITFTRFVSEAEIDTSDFPELVTYDGTFEQLALCKLGENGTCTTVLDAHSLL